MELQSLCSTSRARSTPTAVEASILAATSWERMWTAAATSTAFLPLKYIDSAIGTANCLLHSRTHVQDQGRSQVVHNRLKQGDWSRSTYEGYATGAWEFLVPWAQR